MTRQELAALRLSSQQLTGRPGERPDAVVRRLGAVQAQEYPEAVWAIALRTAAVTAPDVADALLSGRLIRTHVLRPTWHLVCPEDLRWMLALSAPRIITGAAGRWRQLELDDATFTRSNAALAEQVRGSRARTRQELGVALEAAGIATTGQRLPHLLLHAELDQVLCSGGLRGKHHTYMAFDERVPAAEVLTREGAIAALTLRYFASHGPATPQDFAWWSGLTVGDAKAGLAANADALRQVAVEGKPYWYAEGVEAAPLAAPLAHLLPNYDELVVAYRDHGMSLREAREERLPGGMEILRGAVALDGLVVGAWQRTVKKGTVAIGLSLHVTPDEAERVALRQAAERYGAFLGLHVSLI